MPLSTCVRRQSTQRHAHLHRPRMDRNVIIPQAGADRHRQRPTRAGELDHSRWRLEPPITPWSILTAADRPGWPRLSTPLATAPYWANTAIIITWDDWGGWYDHVPPKVINDGVSWGSGYVYGFRVPLVVVSPYAKAAYISHITHDFGSILKFVETTFNLPSLGYADAPADDLSDCFNLTQSPLAFQVIPAPLDAAHFINDNHPFTDPDDD
jgi:phospholipase C